MTDQAEIRINKTADICTYIRKKNLIRSNMCGYNETWLRIRSVTWNIKKSFIEIRILQRICSPKASYRREHNQTRTSQWETNVLLVPIRMRPKLSALGLGWPHKTNLRWPQDGSIVERTRTTFKYRTKTQHQTDSYVYLPATYIWTPQKKANRRCHARIFSAQAFFHFSTLSLLTQTAPPSPSSTCCMSLS